MRFTDPKGEFIFSILPAAIGADIGMWSGGSMANETMNPFQWDFSSGKTWSYMTGGAFVGGIIANSGIPFANTTAIAGSSLTNSLGTLAYTGGKQVLA